MTYEKRNMLSATFIIIPCCFISIVSSAAEDPSAWNGYKCVTGNLSGQQNQTKVVEFTRWVRPEWFQGTAEYSGSRLVSMHAVLSDPARLQYSKYDSMTPEQLLTSTDANLPLATVSVEEKNALLSDLAEARKEELTQKRVPGTIGTYKVTLEYNRDSFGNAAWMIGRVRTVFDAKGKLSLPDAEANVDFLVDKKTGRITSTIFYPIGKQDSFAANTNPLEIHRDKFAVVDPAPSSKMEINTSMAFNEAVKASGARASSTQVGKFSDEIEMKRKFAPPPHIGENIGKEGTTTVDAEFDKEGKILRIQYRAANKSPIDVQGSSKSFDPILNAVTSQQKAIETYAACCADDSPSKCVTRYQPNLKSNERSSKPSPGEKTQR